MELTVVTASDAPHLDQNGASRVPLWSDLTAPIMDVPALNKRQKGSRPVHWNAGGPGIGAADHTPGRRWQTVGRRLTITGRRG